MPLTICRHRTDRIISQAKTWIGTSFFCGGRNKKKNDIESGGCDCLGLIIGIAEELNLYSVKTGKKLSTYDIKGYSPFTEQSHMIKNLDYVLHSYDFIFPGSLLLIKIGFFNYHLAISAGDNRIIHSSIEYKAVVEETMSNLLKHKICSVYLL